eukprot:755942-Hanusia_phi.AAC.2
MGGMSGEGDESGDMKFCVLIVGSPFVYGTQHQFWVRPRKGTKEKHVKENQRTSSGLRSSCLCYSRWKFSLNPGKLPGAFVTLVATDEFALGTLVLHGQNNGDGDDDGDGDGDGDVVDFDDER